MAERIANANIAMGSSPTPEDRAYLMKLCRDSKDRCRELLEKSQEALAHWRRKDGPQYRNFNRKPGCMEALQSAKELIHKSDYLTDEKRRELANEQADLIKNSRKPRRRSPASTPSRKPTGRSRSGTPSK